MYLKTWRITISFNRKLKLLRYYFKQLVHSCAIQWRLLAPDMDTIVQNKHYQSCSLQLSWCVTSSFTRQPILVPNGPAIPVFLGSSLGGVSRSKTGELKAKAWQLFYPLNIDHKASFDWQNEFLQVHIAVKMCGRYCECDVIILSESRAL